MENLVVSGLKLGIIAGGQLGKMLSLAASNWDISTHILDRDENCPAASCCTSLVKGDPMNFEAVYSFGKQVDMLTFEVENVNVEALKRLKEEGLRILPDPVHLELIQDKGLQKQFYRDHGIPTATFRLFDNREDILTGIRNGSLCLPFVQKLRRGGYDGMGVAVVNKPEDLGRMLDGPSIVEEKVEIYREVSVIVARNGNGEIKSFPAVEMEFNHQANLVEHLLCPAVLPQEIQEDTEEQARRVISGLGLTGILAVEMFVDRNRQIWVNEIAPRPHNSGHHTIESVITSQFEQLLRAIFNFPLGSTRLKMPAVMVNLLGEPGHNGKAHYEGLTKCMRLEGVKIHLYGKKITRPYRKMGHVTILDPSMEEALKKAEFIKKTIKITSW